MPNIPTERQILVYVYNVLHLLVYVIKIDLQILYDPSPTPPKDKFSPEFCSLIDACLQKDADKRPTADEVFLFFLIPFFIFIFHSRKIVREHID